MCALVAVTDASRTPAGDFQFPLPLFLTPQIPRDCAAVLHELAQRQHRYARIVDSEEGALCVLYRFEVEDVTALERRRCRVIGYPFAERLLRDASTLAKVHALPLFDFIFRPSAGAVCCSGLMQVVRQRCATLARWMGAKYSEELGPEVGLLVTGRVSLHPESKYQAALQRRLPIVRPSCLEAMWEAKSEVSLEPHALPALCGLGICFSGLQAGEMEELKVQALAAGASSEPLDRAEVVIVKDVFAPRYLEAQRIGILAAPPLWLERCLELRCCVPIAGELEVQNPQSLQLKLFGGPSPAPGAAPTLALVDPTGQGEPESSMMLSDCVICLLYLPPGELRDCAKAMAWRLGAHTTLSPFDRAITHALFKVNPLDKTATQVSVHIDEDRVSFVDMSWLEACSQEGKRVREQSFPQPRINYNPVCDAAYAAVAKGNSSLGSRPTLARTLSRVATAPSSDALGPPPLPAPPPAAAAAAAAGAVLAPPAAEPAAAPHDAKGGTASAAVGGGRPVRAPPTAAGGAFKGMVLELVGWSAEDGRTQALVQKICSNGGTAVYGGSSLDSGCDPSTTVCVVPAFGEAAAAAAGAGHPRTAAAAAAAAVPRATAYWVEACVADGACVPRTSFPHFEPGPGPLPLPEMGNCSVRITALGVSRDSHRRRRHLEELAVVLGARVAQQSTRWSEITHLVCVVPELLDRKTFDSACRKNVPVVTIQWLFDCFKMHARQSEAKYGVAASMLSKMESEGKGSDASLQSARSFVADVLAGHDVLISPSALGSEARLPQMVEELGGTARTWRSPTELATLLDAHGALPSPAAAGAASGGGSGRRHLIVLLDREEVAHEGGPLAGCVAKVAAESRGLFVVPAWLSETFQQRRRLPLEAFAALTPAEPEGAASKRPRLGAGELGDAAYAWQPAALKSLEELAEDSRVRALQSKVERKVSEGLRLAELRREPARLGG